MAYQVGGEDGNFVLTPDRKTIRKFFDLSEACGVAFRLCRERSIETRVINSATGEVVREYGLTDVLEFMANQEFDDEGGA